MSFYDGFPAFNRSFNRDRPNHSTFVQDLRKELESDRQQNRKMFDDDMFGNFFAGHPARASNFRSRLGQHHPAASGFFNRNFESPHSSAGNSSFNPSDSSSGSTNGERVIPIHVCTEEQESSHSSPKPTSDSQAPSSSSANGQQQQPDSSNQKTYSTQRNNTTEMPHVKETQRERSQRAQSAPPSSNDSNANIKQTECGGGQSKKSMNIRTIPIHVESSSSSGGGSTRQQPQVHSNTNSFHPHHQSQQNSSQPSQGGHDGNQPTPPKKVQLDPLQKIQAVAEQVDELAKKVNEFDGSNGKTKEYLYLDEMLTRLLIQLDDVEVEGRDDIRQARRECIRSIQKCISDLDVKSQGSTVSSNSEKQEAENATTATTGEGEGKSDEVTLNATNKHKSSNKKENQDLPMSVDDGAGNQGQGDVDQVSQNVGRTATDTKTENVEPANESTTKAT